METELRRRAEARGLDVGSSLPEGTTSWVACLLKRDRRDAQMRQAPLAVGREHSIFVGTGGAMLTCGRDNVGVESDRALLLGHAVDPDTNPENHRDIDLPTPVPSMQDRRIVSVASSCSHCLGLSAEGEVYSWGGGFYGSLGHNDEGARAVPSRIQSLSHIERIAVGPNWTSAAVDEDGRLFTWGRARFVEEEEKQFTGEIEESEGPTGLGYELDAETEYQAYPKRVDALLQDRVVGVALGYAFTLVVTDAGAVFSCGCGDFDVLGHGSWKNELMPRCIEALTEMGRRFVAVAAGERHALALTEDGELYGWGCEGAANGYGREEHTPHRVAAFNSECIKLVHARALCSCAVTEKGELFTWGFDYAQSAYSLGHGVNTLQQGTPKRVEALVGTRIAAVAIGEYHTLASDEDGVVWAFGEPLGLGLGGPEHLYVKTPTPIPTLRVRALKSP